MKNKKLLYCINKDLTIVPMEADYEINLQLETLYCKDIATEEEMSIERFINPLKENEKPENVLFYDNENKPPFSEVRNYYVKLKYLRYTEEQINQIISDYYNFLCDRYSDQKSKRKLK